MNSYPGGDPGADNEPVPTTSRRAVLATALLTLAVAEAATTLVTAVPSGLGWARLVDLFVVTNTVIGLSLAAAGWPIARYRSDNPVGWWLLAGGCLYGATAAGITVLACAAEPGRPAAAGWRIAATVTNGCWPWALALCIPMALLHFPDGRLPGPRWRWVVAVVVTGSVLFAATAVLDPLGGLNAEVGVPGYPAWSGAARFGWVAAVAGVLVAVGYVALPVALVVRYRHGSDRERRQLLWPVLAVLVLVTGAAAANLFGDAAFILLGVLPLTLVPASIAVALLRHGLLDIQLVVSRSLLYLLLTAGVVGTFIAVVGLLDRTVRRQLPVHSSIVAALVIALAFNPVRLWLQRIVDRGLYGARRDPVRALAAVGARLSDADVASVAGLDGILAALCRVLRLPAAAITAGGTELAGFGVLPADRHGFELQQGDEIVGELVVGLRAGERRLDRADAHVIGLLTAPVAVAVQAGRLAEELKVSRERVISGREEERRRIRRDLHDGLGPVLTSVVLNADAAWHLIDSDPRRGAELIATVRDRTVTAIEDIRRLVYDLRPPALDGLGLVGALREYAVGVAGRADGAPLAVTVDASPALAELPAAVEVAAYRIATEAIANVARHSTAANAVVTLRPEAGHLRVSVHDNGPARGEWTPGVGLTSIRQRAAELGGSCRIDHDATGARVDVTLPVPSGPDGVQPPPRVAAGGNEPAGMPG